MENATRALIIAGSVLIALMIIGALLLMFNGLSSYQKVGDQNKEEAQIVEFNNQYETFNRKNVRGSDLYSLLNRVVDFNRRKSTEGVGNDDGQYIAYQPMTISFDLNGKQEEFWAPTASNNDTYTHLITKDGYQQGSTQNEFEKDIASKIDKIENTYGQNNLISLTTGLTKIFIADNSSDDEKEAALDDFNKYYKGQSITTWKPIGEGSKIRQDVYQYYEYIQFKRAKFNCEANQYSDVGIRYNEKTGRIIEINFKFTGKFQ